MSEEVVYDALPSPVMAALGVAVMVASGLAWLTSARYREIARAHAWERRRRVREAEERVRREGASS